MDSEKNHLDKLRHSCAHLLAKAVRSLWPEARNAIGPAIENGFYQDFDMGSVKISEADLPRIEEKMQELLAGWKIFAFKEVTLAEAEKLFADNPYKVEMARELAREGKKLTTNDPGDFLDLCKMDHVENPSRELKYFKLLSIAGAYWRGDEKKKMLTRIYGTCFPTKKDLDTYLWQITEAKKRDHRKLGRELDLFVFSDLVGRGLPLFTPKGTILRDLLDQFSQELRIKRGFKKVWIPHITKHILYETSGHWEKFKNELLVAPSRETQDKLVLKPMNCPHHQQLYASKPRSFKDLPIKYLETTTVYRDEKAGEMMGLSRVRSVTQDDSHIFCTPDQIKDVYRELIDIINEFYGSLGMKYHARLSFRDPSQPDKYLGDPVLWDQAQAILTEIAQSTKLHHFVAEGEAAFYGPKIDVMVTDVLGREWQLATPQLDFVQPKRFGLTYLDSQSRKQTPVMIHFALMGSLERFLSVYIEHTGGKFPLWLAPIQVVVIPIADRHHQKAQEVYKLLTSASFRVEIDLRPESMQAKIRAATLQKIPLMAIMGDKELESGTMSVRSREGKTFTLTIPNFVKNLQQDIETKR